MKHPPPDANEEDLRKQVQALVTAYRARLSCPITEENLREAETLEDELYHVGLALRALGKV